jgi:hypothetical protein
VKLPQPRGPVSDHLCHVLRRSPQGVRPVPFTIRDALSDDDLHLSLAICYEIANGGIEGVDERWEWEPSLLALRARLEAPFEQALRDAMRFAIGPGEIGAQLRTMRATAGAGPSVSRFIAEDASPEQAAEFLVHRSYYQLREADPHTWAIPRLRGAAKAALVMVQADEYGNGVEERMHSSLFRRTMEAFELDTTEGAYIDLLPAETLAQTNLMFLFGMHRRLRAAAVGHLAMFEMTSTVPNQAYGDGLRRMGFGPDATEFFDEHVSADAVHERIAADVLAAAVAAEGPEAAWNVLFGAHSLLLVECRWAERLCEAWRADRSLLRRRLMTSVTAA